MTPFFGNFARGLSYRLLCASGAVRRARHENRRLGRILLYHSVAPKETVFTRGLGVTVKAATFARQLDYLVRHYQVVSLDELEKSLAQDGPSNRYVALTFDDGFADNLHYALPALKERNLPATVFLVADALDDGRLLWMHRLAYLVNTRGIDVVLRAGESALGEPPANGGPGSAAWANFREKMMCGLQSRERDRILDMICDALGKSPEDAPERRDLYLKRTDIETMRAHGIAVGSHGATHTAFSAMSPEQQEEELHRGWLAVAPWTDGSPPALAYPFGEPRHYTDTSRRLALKTGHRRLLTVGEGWVTPQSDPTSMDRIKIEEEPMEAFAARLVGISARSWLAGLGGRRSD